MEILLTILIQYTVKQTGDGNQENYKLGGMFRYNTKFSGLANKEMYDQQLGELSFRSWE